MWSVWFNISVTQRAFHYWWIVQSITFNPSGPRNGIWRWKSWSTLVQVMACCLTAPSHYLNQCSLIFSKVLWHSSDAIIMRRFEDTNQYSKIRDSIFKIILRSLRSQWVNPYCHVPRDTVSTSRELWMFVQTPHSSPERARHRVILWIIFLLFGCRLPPTTIYDEIGSAARNVHCYTVIGCW